MRFFFDNCIAQIYAESLHLLCKSKGQSIVHLRTMFPQGIDDLEWIPALGKEGDWIIVSGDPRITRRKSEKEAWRESGLTAFFLGDGWSSKSYWVQIGELVRWWPTIVELANTAEKGVGFILTFKAQEPRIVYPPGREEGKPRKE